MNTTVYVASAFSKDGRGGNRAGVVLYQDELGEGDKKLIAKKLGYSETAYVTASDKADLRIEYFTPAEEVPLCGHATIATFIIMMHLGKIDKPSYKIETKSGILDIKIDGATILMEQNKPEFFDVIGPDELSPCFDIDCIDRDSFSQIVSTGLKDIIIPVRSEDLLGRMVPDFDRITEVSRRYDVVGMHLYALEGDRIICRNFAPLYDIDEESATGTSNCALASLLYEKRGIIRDTYVFEQGYSLGAPSEIRVRIEGDETGTHVNRIFVGGAGYYIETLTI